MTIRETTDSLVDYEQAFQSLFVDPTALGSFSVQESKGTKEYNYWAKMYGLPLLTNAIKIDHDKNQSIWAMPSEYEELDILKYVLDLCKTEDQQARAAEELALFQENNMLDLLRYLVYLVDTMRKNKVVWGVGRGSSVSSYVLYLIGVHCVDSLKYKLDLKDFFKDSI